MDLEKSNYLVVRLCAENHFMCHSRCVVVVFAAFSNFRNAITKMDDNYHWEIETGSEKWCVLTLHHIHTPKPL